MTNKQKIKIIKECEQNNKEYMDLLKDKKVIIVGPSGNLIGKNLGEKIDNYDVVVRLNNSLAIDKKIEVDLGSRTDVLYHISGKLFNILTFVSTKVKKKPGEILVDMGVKYIFFKQGWNSKGKRSRKHFWEFVNMINIKVSPIRAILLYLKKELNGTDPNMGVLAITHILKSKCKSLTVVGCDFYSGQYYPGYVILPEHYFDFKERRLKAKKGNWKQKQKHSVRLQLFYLDKILKSDNRLILNKELKELIKKKDTEVR